MSMFYTVNNISIKRVVLNLTNKDGDTFLVDVGILI